MTWQKKKHIMKNEVKLKANVHFDLKKNEFNHLGNSDNIMSMFIYRKNVNALQKQIQNKIFFGIKTYFTNETTYQTSDPLPSIAMTSLMVDHIFINH